MKIFIVFCCLCSITDTHGLQLRLDLTQPTVSKSVSYCGVLTCEKSHKSNTGTPEGGETSGIISSMSIFKNSTTSSNGQGNTGYGKLLASLTLERPSITRVSDGVKINGHLNTERARIRLELSKKEDCRAEYTCESRTVDENGKESTNIYRLRQQQTQNAYSADSAVVSPAGPIQTLLFSQMLDTKLALLESSFERKVISLKEHLEDKLMSLQDAAERHKDEIRDKIESRTREIEDKIESRVVDKLCEFDKKFSHFDDIIGRIERIQQDKEENLSSLKSHLKANEPEKLTEILAVVEMIDSGLNNTLSSLLTDLLARETKTEYRFENLTEAIQQLDDKSNTLKKNIDKSSTKMQDNLQTMFTQLKIDFDESLGDILSRSNWFLNASSLANYFQLLMTNIHTPKVCRKGMRSVPAPDFLPYPVIQLRAHFGVDVPYLCDTITDGGGWIIFQRRATGNVDFYRDWATYKKGFGSLAGDFWLGNQNIHAITRSGTYELRVELKYQGKSAFAHYSNFSLDSEKNDYTLRLGAYDGTAGDSLSYHRGNKFSTFDRDNDLGREHCAKQYTGGWWYNNCYTSNLNGRWQADNSERPRWSEFSGSDSVTFSEMKIRLVQNA